MKQKILSDLAKFKTNLQLLKRLVNDVPGEAVARKATRELAEAIATEWVEDLRSPLEHRFKLSVDVIAETSELMKQLHKLSRPNNRKDSYLKAIGAVLRKFDDRFVLPIQQTEVRIESLLDLEKLIPAINNKDDSAYLSEAIKCAGHGFRHAAIVLGWCAAISRLQRKLVALGLDKFNATSRRMKAKTTGNAKYFNKEFSVSTLSDLQGVFDSDLIRVIEGMDLLDGNEAERLLSNFKTRNQCAHPSDAPVEDPHLVAFFTDITRIVLTNPKFEL